MAAETIARREIELMEKPDQVRVFVRTSMRSGMCLPDLAGEREETAVFHVLSVGDNMALEKACWYEEQRADGGTQRETDYNEFRRLLLKRNLLWWSLEPPIERVNGWMTKTCYARVSRVFAPLVDAFIHEYEKHIEISKDDEQTIARQAAVLFGKHSRGVSDACEAVSLYCSRSSFWEKFGLGRDELSSLPYREFLLLRMMSSHENEAMRRNSQPHKESNTRIAGAGGRIRPSRGIKVPM